MSSIRGERIPTYVHTVVLDGSSNLSPKFVGNLINSNKNIERVDEAFTKNYVRDKFYSIHAHCYYPSGFNPTKYSNVVNLDPEDENKVNYYVSEHKKNNKIVCLREESK